MKSILNVQDNTNERANNERRSFLKSILLGITAGTLGSHLTILGQAQKTLRTANPNIARKVETDADIERLLPELKNWGRWGKEDQLGTLNYITPEHRRKAASLVKTGRTVTLAREASVTKTEGIRRGTYEMMRDAGGSRDFIGMIFHGFAQTHLDALCHAFTPDGKMYNGFAADEVTPQGANKLGVETMAAQEITGRSVLLDIAALKGAALAPGSQFLLPIWKPPNESRKFALERAIFCLSALARASAANLILYYSHATRESPKQAVSILEDFVTGEVSAQRKKAS